MPQPLQRSTLIAGIFAIGSFLLCCVSGIIGWFNAYWALTVVITACCFFLLVICSTGLSLLHACKRQDTSDNKSRLVRIGCIVFSIVVLITAHLFTITRNLSPSENLLGNHDQGMYLAAASHLNTNGSHSMTTDWISQSSAEYKGFLTKEISPSLKTESLSKKTNTGTQAGFYLMDDGESSQYIQFPPGYPTLLAIFWSLGDYALVAYSNAIICLLCGLMIATLSRNFIGIAGALATWLLFLFCPLTLWSANYLYAEPILLLLWLIALWSLNFTEDYPWLSATLASMSIGAGFLIKIDALPLLLVPLTFALLGKRQCRRFQSAFLIFSIVTFLSVTCIYLNYSKPYFEFTLSGLLAGRLPVTASGTLLLTSILAFKPARLKISETVRRHSKLLRCTLAVSIALLLLYFYFIRPYSAEPHKVFSDESGADIESLREQTFYRLGWYFTPLGLALASTGLVAAFVKRAHSAQHVFTGMATLFLIYYSYDIHCTPYQPYAMRRLFPFVVPALCFCIPLLIQKIPIKRYSIIAKTILTALITTALLFQFQQISRKLILRDNYSGLYEYLFTISRSLPKNECILMNGNGKACIYAAPLRYLFEQECILIYPDYRNRDYHEMMRHFAENNKGLLYVLSTSPNDRMSIRAEIISTQKLSDTLQATYSGTATTDYPDNDVKPFNLSLYLTELRIP